MKFFFYAVLAFLSLLQMGAAGFAIYYILNGWTEGLIDFDFVVFGFWLVLALAVLYLAWSLLRVVDILADEQKH